MRRTAVVVAVLALGACGGSDEGSSEPAEPPSVEEQQAVARGSEDEQEARAEAMRPDDAFAVETETFGTVWVSGAMAYPTTCEQADAIEADPPKLVAEVEAAGGFVPDGISGFGTVTPNCP